MFCSLDIKQLLRVGSTASLRYLPTILKLAVFAFLDYSGNQELTGNYGLYFASISAGSFFLGLDITSILHRKYLNNTLSINGLLNIQIISVVIMPGIFLLLSTILGITPWLLALAIFTELIAQELYRSSMIFVTLKKYTLFYVLKNSLPIVLLFCTRTVEYSVIAANIISAMIGVIILRRLVCSIRPEMVSLIAVKNILRDSILNLPNALFLRSLELGLRHLLGNSPTVQSRINYLVMIGNGIYSLYDVFVVNVHYKKWMEGFYRFEIAKSIQYSFIVLILIPIYFDQDLFVFALIYIFVMIVGHSKMMNNLADSRTSLLLLLGLLFSYCGALFVYQLICLMPLIIVVYGSAKLSKYEIRHKDNLYFKV